MKKISFLLLAALIACPAFAEDYDEEYDSYDDESYTTTTSCNCDTNKDSRDTYAGLRFHRNEHILFEYDKHDAHHANIRDNNFGVGLNIGNRLTENVKLEFETMYTGAKDNKYDTEFNYDIWSNMLNVYLYNNYGKAVEPYVGIGIGLTGIWGEIDGTGIKENDTDFDLSFAVMAGANFALNQYVDLNIGVRYIDYGSVEHKSATTHVDATEIYIGAAYKFGIFK